MERKIVALVVVFLVGIGAAIDNLIVRETQGHPAARHAYYRIENEATKILRKGFAATGRCGIERWDEKTLSNNDPPSATILAATSSRRTTVPALRSLPVPGGVPPSGARVPGPETSLYRLSGTWLAAYKLELDSDIHLALRSSIDGSTMIAEIPDPGCVANPAAAARIAAARDVFVREVGTPAGYYRDTHVRIAITGPAFFDFNHRQNGVAPNGIELHPILSFRVLRPPTS